MTDDGRLLTYGIYLAWAVASVIAWGKVLHDGIEFYRTWHDARARRALVDAIGLFLVAAACFFSLVVLIFGQSVVGLRGFALAVALGSFLAVGIIKATVNQRRKRAIRGGRRVGDPS